MAPWPGRTALMTLTAAVPIMAANFSAGSRDGWQEQTFRGKPRTSYTMVQEGGAYALLADSRGSASGLVRPMDLDLTSTPRIRWSWKVAGTLPGGDEHRKEGDDYGARIYLIFSHPLPWMTRAIAYIWANRLPVGETLPNAYSSNLRMVAVESGNTRTGHWLTEERNVVEDYRRLFGSSPPRLQGVGIMTDSDDTRGEARAWYGTISFHPL